MQAEYVSAPSDAQRRAVAVAFLVAVRELDKNDQEEPLSPLAAELERIVMLQAVPGCLAEDRAATDRYWRAMAAAKLVDAGETRRAAAEQLEIAPSTVSRDLRWLDTFDLPDWLRPRSAPPR